MGQSELYQQQNHSEVKSLALKNRARKLSNRNIPFENENELRLQKLSHSV